MKSPRGERSMQLEQMVALVRLDQKERSENPESKDLREGLAFQVYLACLEPLALSLTVSPSFSSCNCQLELIKDPLSLTCKRLLDPPDLVDRQVNTES